MNVFQRVHSIHRLLRYRYRTERVELKYLLSRDIHGGCVLDIGAFRGVYSFWMHRRFRDTRVVAFEPQSELAEFLDDFKQTFHLDRMLIVPVGLSSCRGTMRMHRPHAHWGGATVDEYCLDDDQTEVFDVPVTTIDEFLAEHPELRPVRFIKCDVEYHEAEVLAGAERTLREDRPEVLVEWTTPRRNYRERLYGLALRLGYCIYQFECGRLAPCTSAERAIPPSWELGPNYVLRPREKAEPAAA